jgi:probable addiction module antidote protein
MGRIQKKNEPKINASRHFDEFLDEELRKDPLLAVEYLNTAMQDEDQRMFLIALSNVVRAYGTGQIAEQTKLDRTNLYRMLGSEGNPRLSSLAAILDAVGMRLSITAKGTVSKPARKRKSAA